MTADQWRMRLFPIDKRPAYVRELLSDLSELESGSELLCSSLERCEAREKTEHEAHLSWKAACHQAEAEANDLRKAWAAAENRKAR